MKTLKIDESNDIVFSGGHLQIVKDKDAHANICRHYALANRGEMVLKKDKGIPFFDIALGSNPSPAQYEAAFRARMKELDFVKSVTDFEAAIIDGELKYSATIETNNKEEIRVNESL